MGSLGVSEDAYLSTVLKPFRYVSGMKGKGLRRKIANAFNHWFDVSEDDLEIIHQLFQDLHNASLLIDDIEDGSDLRRSLPAGHIVYGIAQAINSANYIYFDVLRRVVDAGWNDLIPPFLHEVLEMHVGQGMEIYWREENMKSSADHECLKNIPSEKEYEDVIVRKTSGQFNLLCTALKFRARKISSVNLSRLGQLVGLHFQVRDDYLNLVSAKYEAGKGFCEDFTEGKISYPIIIAIQKLKQSDQEDVAVRLLQILKMQTTDRDIKQEALDIVRNCGALDYTKARLESLQMQMSKEILRFGGNPALAQMEVFNIEL